MKLILTLAACCAALASAAQAETLRVPRLDDTHIQAYVDAPADGRRAGILLVLQGSECLSVHPGGDRFPFDLPADVVRLDIEKYGITAESEGAGEACPEAYLANNTIDGRVLDALTTLAWLKANAPWWDGRLFVAGASEGATIAAIVGALHPDTQGMILVNGSIGRPFGEGWADAVATAVSSQGGDEAAVAAARADTQAAWDKARANPTVETYQGASNTLRWWRSIIDLRPINLLVSARAPVLLVQAEKDQMTPVASARAAAERLSQAKSNFTYVELPGLDHGFRDGDGKPQYQMILPRLNAALAEQAAMSRGAAQD